ELQSSASCTAQAACDLPSGTCSTLSCPGDGAACQWSAANTPRIPFGQTAQAAGLANNWGWLSGPLPGRGVYTVPFVQGAGQNALNKGTVSGTVQVQWPGAGCANGGITVRVDLTGGHSFDG